MVVVITGKEPRFLPSASLPACTVWTIWHLVQGFFSGQGWSGLMSQHLSPEVGSGHTCMCVYTRVQVLWTRRVCSSVLPSWAASEALCPCLPWKSRSHAPGWGTVGREPSVWGATCGGQDITVHMCAHLFREGHPVGPWRTKEHRWVESSQESGFVLPERLLTTLLPPLQDGCQDKWATGCLKGPCSPEGQWHLWVSAFRPLCSKPDRSQADVHQTPLLDVGMPRTSKAL